MYYKPLSTSNMMMRHSEPDYPPEPCNECGKIYETHELYRTQYGILCYSCQSKYDDIYNPLYDNIKK